MIRMAMGGDGRHLPVYRLLACDAKEMALSGGLKGE
jgi:hypothetical protein